MQNQNVSLHDGTKSNQMEPLEPMIGNQPTSSRESSFKTLKNGFDSVSDCSSMG